MLLLLVGTEVLAQRVEYKTFPSKLLGRELRYGVYLPPSYSKSPEKKYPVLYFLHGLFEDETRWSTRGETDQILDRMIGDGKIGEFIVALPYGGTSFYTNMRDGSEKWEDVMVTEFLPLIESSYRVNASRAQRGISGTSMGGYGALKIAMKHPDLFGSASSHSAVLLQDLSACQGLCRTACTIPDAFRPHLRNQSGPHLLGIQQSHDAGQGHEEVKRLEAVLRLRHRG
jgi:S-formylglutathione hydrolase FrmB